MESFQSTQAAGDLGAMQLLLNQVKTLQDQVTQLSSNNGQQNFGNTGQQASVQSMANAGPEMDLKTMMSARLQGLNGVPAYGSLNMSEGILQGTNPTSMTEEGCCIWVQGIPEDLRNTTAIGNIFGNYGNVMRIKFSRKKPDGALVEMQNSDYAAKCCKYLHDTKLSGARLSVRLSRIPHVSNILPHENDDQAKDFSRGFEHRYRDVDSKFTKIIMKRLSDPTPVLCISNVPEGKISELKDYIVESGFTIKTVEEGKARKQTEGEPSKKRQDFAFVEFESTEEAICAVAKLHNTMPKSIGEKKFRGITFSFTSRRNLAA